MSLRQAAIVIGALALLAAFFGCLPGRETTRDISDCYLTGLFEGSFIPVRPCDRDWVMYTRSAVDVSVVATLVVVAIGAACVVLVPRRRVAGGWLTISAFAGFIAFVVTRSWAVRPGETIALWPRYATWGIVGVISTAMFGVLIWLIMTDGIAISLPVARVVVRRSSRG